LFNGGRVYVGVADGLDRERPFNAWHAILHQLLHLRRSKR
jgi:hypothetical protein